MAHSWPQRRFVVTSVLVIALSWMPACGEDFAGGSGTPADPYQIADANQLISAGSDPNLFDKHFVLTADIDLDPGLPGRRVFEGAVIAADDQPYDRFPGWSGRPFDGSFDGRGHRVHNLRIEHRAGYGIGLFGEIGVNGRVCNLGVEGECVIGEASGQVAGLAGINGGVIRACYFRGSVKGTTAVGGLVGANHGVVVACSSSGTVAGRDLVGGLVGDNTEGIVANSCSTAAISGANLVGGLVGYGQPYLVINGYFLDSGNGATNGLGTAVSDAQMKQRESFVGWDFHGVPEDGGREIWFMPPGGYPALAWQSELTGLVWLPQVQGSSLDTAQALATAAGLTQGAVRYDYSEDVPADHVVALEPSYPVPVGQVVDIIVSKGRCDWLENPGDGSSAQPYRISSAGELESVGRYPESHFVLTSDIDLNGRVFSNAVVCADVNTIWDSFQGRPFAGSFEGRSHTISGLTIVSTAEYVGLFGNIGAQGTVQDLSLEDVWVVGMVRSSPSSGSGDGPGPPGRCGVGALASESSGAITRCASSGWVMGTYEVGGLLGKLAGSSAKMAGCSADAVVWGHGFLGGLVGTNEGQIDNCYAAGMVSGDYALAGLVGFNEGRISTCYTGAAIWSFPEDGFLCGLVSARPSDSATCRDSYFLSDADCQNITFPDFQAMALPDPNLRERDSFVGWDFFGSSEDGIDDDWFMPADGYPVLTWQTDRSGLRRMPQVVGLATEEAQALLREAGLAVSEVHTDFDSSLPAGTVIATVPQRYAALGQPVNLLESLGTYNWNTNPGDGTAVNPYEIQTVGQLRAIRFLPEPEPMQDYQYLGGTFYVLANDLDMSWWTFDQAPVHTWLDILDGRGHTISHLTISADEPNLVALFGTIGPGALVANLTIQDAYIGGDDTEYVGALAARNEGMVENCHASGVVRGSGAVGGLIGENEGMVTACHAKGAVTGKQVVVTYAGEPQPQTSDSTGTGGLVGVCKSGIVSACYADAKVTGEEDVDNLGGLIGQLGKREIERRTTTTQDPRSWPPTTTTKVTEIETLHTGDVVNSYATGLVYESPSSSNVGALIGHVFQGDMANCYAADWPLAGNTTYAVSCYDLSWRISPRSPDWRGEPAPQVFGLTPDQMKHQQSFVGWDFDNIWTICEGLDYPRLWWEDRQCPEQ